MTRLRSPSFRKELEHYCDRLKDIYGNLTIILSGSTAVGEDMPWSDVDLIVIADFKKPFIERLEELTPPINSHINFEVVAYTPEEFKQMFHQLNIKAIEAVEDGIPIVSGPILGELKARLVELKRRGLTKTKCSYILLQPEAS